jgi:hypothetical protein
MTLAEYMESVNLQKGMPPGGPHLARGRLPCSTATDFPPGNLNSLPFLGLLVKFYNIMSCLL